MTYSVVDVIVGMASHQYESSFSLFVTHGPLFENPVLGEIGVIIRCSFVGLSYGIFEIHFIYRYIVLCRDRKSYYPKNDEMIYEPFLVKAIPQTDDQLFFHSMTQQGISFED
ncbi:unnamed protein product [Caenorhabditis auriculariae]|uniref:Uncharacterized protein n=1 Tax=Caenorhabditis auriculariae TaxID=2777116 RepID=A0A8S1HFL3_9PELO|nr:unnamed protein product [Caenorhabditis auriculariae]